MTTETISIAENRMTSAWSHLANQTDSVLRKNFTVTVTFAVVSDVVVSEYFDDLSWARLPKFQAKLVAAFEDVEQGKYDAVTTIDELIEHINAQAKKNT